jgi:hypothetical protein
MKRCTVLLVALALTLLVSGSALAQGGGGRQANAVTLSGGRYRLVSTSAQAGVIASGGQYRLLPALSGAEGGPASPSGGNQCCCTFLPCVLRSH